MPPPVTYSSAPRSRSCRCWGLHSHSGWFDTSTLCWGSKPVPPACSHWSFIDCAVSTHLVENSSN